MDTPERKRRGAAWARWLVMIAWVSLCASSWSGSAQGETVWLQRRSMALAEGLELTFHTHQIYGVDDVYSSQVRLSRVDQGPQGEPRLVTFHWRMLGAQPGKHQGLRGEVTTSGLLQGRSLNAWWGRSKISTSDTQLWLSLQACQELQEQGQTHFALDRQARRDSQLLLRRVGQRSYGFLMDGQPVRRQAWELRSEKGDRLWVLADCTHPLVVEAEMKDLYEVRLTGVRTQSPDWR